MIVMKSILAILAIGLMLATAFSGCVGGEKTTSTDTTTGIDTTVGNETENQTDVNQTAPPRANYHMEQSGTHMIHEGALGNKYFPFPVDEGAKKIILKASAVGTPGAPIGGCGFWILDSGGNEKSEDFSQDGQEIVRELKEGAIKSGGYGEWQIMVCMQLLDVSADFKFSVDVLYS
ncbi:MAG: hypothetical protein CVT47_00455 [Thermoplasmata archaeon HGW-Thermoplasmata-2]|nr:MAG: hypothetical protein CVT47_00455 [Thermoplasmata archaeon HGW-Thermoplasmata-2]